MKEVEIAAEGSVELQNMLAKNQEVNLYTIHTLYQAK